LQNVSLMHTGIYCHIGADIMFTNNLVRFCNVSLDLDHSDVVRPMVFGNNWRGCKNDCLNSSATNPRVRDNIDKDGNWFGW